MQAWFAVLTKPRAEAIAHTHLVRQGYECLLPRVRRRVLRGTRGLGPRVESLFPNYLFLCADPEHTSLAPVRSTRGALGLVSFGGTPAQVPQTVIDRIRERTRDGDGLIELEAPPLQPGQKVHVTDGPFAGLEAVFVLHEGLQRVRLLFELLGSSREIVLPRTQLALRL